jgi:hypothetical protein
MGMYGGSGGMYGGGGAMPGSFRGGMAGGQAVNTPMYPAGGVGPTNQLPFTAYANNNLQNASNAMYMGPQSDTGFNGVPWQTALASMLQGGGNMQAMPYGGGGQQGGMQNGQPRPFASSAQQAQNDIWRQQGLDAMGGAPNAYANLQAKVAANHPGWNQNRIDNRAALRLGKRGV